MTLADKFKEGINFPSKTSLDNCEKIADEFAIGFAEWSDNNYFRMGATSMWTASLDYEDDIIYQTKELLEIYKKEKGL